jgi:hypothetical protein
MLYESKPHVIKDYGNFAIVEINEEIYIWNKDIYGEGAMLRMDPQKAESEDKE